MGAGNGTYHQVVDTDPEPESGLSLELPWPESEALVRDRVAKLVQSVVHGDELIAVRLDWRTPSAHRWDMEHADLIALRLTVSAIGDEVFEKEIWGANWYAHWEGALDDLASDLEDWVCETGFGWGQQRCAVVPAANSHK